MSYSWNKPRAPANHSEDWLMTYADLITLLLCFFAIIIITTASKKGAVPVTPPPATVHEQVSVKLADQVEAKHTIKRDRPVAFFDGGASMVDLGSGVTDQDRSVLQPENPKILPQTKDQENPSAALTTTARENGAPSSALASGATSQTSAVPDADASATPVGTAQIPVPQISLPQIIENAKEKGPAAFEQKGDRITSLELNSAAFFDSGSAVLSGAGKVILHELAANLRSEKFKDYLITVEGHTDDTPVHSLQFPSNWELSTARAAAVVRFFLEEGMPAVKLRAAGYADTFPKAPNRDAAGHAISANQARNRRVVIKLEKIDKL